MSGVSLLIKNRDFNRFNLKAKAVKMIMHSMQFWVQVSIYTFSTLTAQHFALATEEFYFIYLIERLIFSEAIDNGS